MGQHRIAQDPGDGEAAETALKTADLALYRARLTDAAPFRLFEPAMDAAHARRRTGAGLRHGHGTGRSNFYQPIMDKHATDPKFEACITLRAPSAGWCFPVEVIP